MPVPGTRSPLDQEPSLEPVQKTDTPDIDVLDTARPELEIINARIQELETQKKTAEKRRTVANDKAQAAKRGSKKQGKLFDEVDAARAERDNLDVEIEIALSKRNKQAVELHQKDKDAGIVEQAPKTDTQDVTPSIQAREASQRRSESRKTCSSGESGRTRNPVSRGDYSGGLRGSEVYAAGASSTIPKRARAGKPRRASNLTGAKPLLVTE